MPETAYATPCPVCGAAVIYARMLAPASLILTDRDVTCGECKSLFRLSVGIQRGVAGEATTAVIPQAGGDSGGVGALLG